MTNAGGRCDEGWNDTRWSANVALPGRDPQAGTKQRALGRTVSPSLIGPVEKAISAPLIDPMGTGD